MKISGGTNAEIHLITGGGYKLINKTYSHKKLSIDLGILILHDIIELRKIFSKKHLKTSKIESIAIKDGSFSILEKFCGPSIRDLIRNNHKDVDKHIAQCIDYIKQIPQNIPVDTNPANFTVYQDSIYFVDFTPPYPWKYVTNKETQNSLQEIFPTLKPRVADSNGERERVNRYYKTTSRIKKFMFYVDSYKNGTIIKLAGEGRGERRE